MERKREVKTSPELNIRREKKEGEKGKEEKEYILGKMDSVKE